MKVVPDLDGVKTALGDTVASVIFVAALTSWYEAVSRLKYKRYMVLNPAPETLSIPVGIIVLVGELPCTT